MSVNKKVLIIEDNRDIRENIAELLALSGYEVDSADNGKAGIVLALLNLPDIILCDIMMPVLDGYAVLARLRKYPQMTGIPFLFLTAKAERRDISRGLDSGADTYLVKPFDADDLLTAIESSLRVSAAQNALFSAGE
jgi:DNA-binding response OmpR family regulator